MSERITSAHVYTRFINLCNRLGKKCFIPESDMKRLCKNNKYFPKPDHSASKYNEIGCWSLGHSYGRWSIEEMDNALGGISHPLGNDSRTAREFVEAVSFALCFDWYKTTQKGKNA